MARAPSPLPRLKSVEKHLRDAANACRSAIEELDSSLSSGRTNADRVLLTSLRDQMQVVHEGAKKVYGRLINEIEI